MKHNKRQKTQLNIMNVRYLFVAVMMIAVILPASAQRKAKTTKKKSKAKVENTISEEEMRRQQHYDMLLSATQDVVFIDSMVVDKKDAFKHFSLSQEAGLISSYESFFNNAEQLNSTVYLNDLGDKCFYSLADTSRHSRLYSSDFLDGQWTAPDTIKGIAEDTAFVNADFPFVMPDGQTLYFAAKGEGSVGGYDIFVTRYDSETGQYLKAENIGMPFNSKANDYLYAIDEMENIGWFVTDRRQPEGKVCIYIFIPSEVRSTYKDKGMSDEKIKRLADIHSIKETWGDGTQRRKALARLSALKTKTIKKAEHFTFTFVIDNNHVYTDISQFKSSEAKVLFTDYLFKDNEKRKLMAKLDGDRISYANSQGSQRQQLKAEILQNEIRVESLSKEISNMAKSIIAKELQVINK